MTGRGRKPPPPTKKGRARGMAKQYSPQKNDKDWKFTTDDILNIMQACEFAMEAQGNIDRHMVFRELHKKASYQLDDYLDAEIPKK